ncbi:MAG: P-II family nitrogen regulator [Paludibacter sp.]
MKKIEAIIRRSKFEDVKDALHSIDIDFFTYSETYGVGNERKEKNVFRGSTDTSNISRLTLSIVVRDINLQKTIDCLLDTAYTGEVGDGKLFVSTIDESYRIRTREKGDESLYVK